MTKKKILISLVVLLLVYFWFNPIYINYDKKHLSKTEQAMIENFYEYSPDLISKGEMFDVKYVQYGDTVDTCFFEVIVKTRTKIRDFEIYSFVSKKGEDGFFTLKSNGISFQESFCYNGWFEKCYYNYKYLTGSSVFPFTNPNTTYEDFYIEIVYPGGSEVHHLVANKESQFDLVDTITNVEKNKVESYDYRKYIAEFRNNYYFQLFHRDFEEWNNELTEFIENNRNEIKKENPTIYINETMFGKKENLVLLSEEELSKVLELMNYLEEHHYFEVHPYLDEYNEELLLQLNER